MQRAVSHKRCHSPRLLQPAISKDNNGGGNDVPSDVIGLSASQVAAYDGERGTEPARGRHRAGRKYVTPPPPDEHNESRAHDMKSPAPIQHLVFSNRYHVMAPYY